MDRTGKTGVLLIGASGCIAAAVMSGAFAMKRGLCPRTGMVTALDAFSGLGLADPGEMVFGGWEIRSASPLEAAREYFASARLPAETLSAIEPDLAAASENVREGLSTNCGRAVEALSDLPGQRHPLPLSEEVARLRRDIRAFCGTHSIEAAVVVNLASTEPPLEAGLSGLSIDGFEQRVREDRPGEMRASALYAYAAILEGCPYINFTPSAALPEALVELAERTLVPVMGNDGKTGETLVKSALLPMFLCRNLEVLSWEGFNILGNMDGRVLDDPDNRASKVKTKDGFLNKVLGYSPHSSVSIQYVPSLDDQKTAWDFIHFSGFFGAKMSLQLIWQGLDSLLAAPLVLDLVRLADLSRRRGEAGPMRHLASFFKAPVGVDEHRFYEQAQMLFSYAGQAVESGARA